ncbi:MAG: YHS domain-containing (seleno)protein [Leptothrix sp. (in: b-proteobacteria)]
MTARFDSPRAGLRALLLSALVAAPLWLSGCASIQAFNAQNPSSSLRPVNAVADPDDAHLLLRGHDVVAYVTDGKPVMGSAQFKTVRDGVTLRFASAEHLAMFEADPARYLPKFGGYCATGIAYAIPWGGDAATWKVIDNRLFIFGGPGAKAAWELDEPGNLALAERYWRDEVDGHNSFVQRAKRLVFRVPHYKSDAQLQAMVAAAAQAPAKP